VSSGVASSVAGTICINFVLRISFHVVISKKFDVHILPLQQTLEEVQLMKVWGPR
jgi:hypothetical protein